MIALSIVAHLLLVFSFLMSAIISDGVIGWIVKRCYHKIFGENRWHYRSVGVSLHLEIETVDCFLPSRSDETA